MARNIHIKNLMIRAKNRFLIHHQKSLLKTKDFSILSQNCIGGVFYHDMGLKFLSPTINLFFSGSDFVRFVINLDYYLAQELRMTQGEDYPVGYLDDVRINFQHYESCAEAKAKWDERKQRIRKDRIIVLCTDRDGFSEETYDQWRKIQYPKVLFSSTDRMEPDVVFLKKYSNSDTVGDLISEREFYYKDRLIKTVNKTGNEL